MNTFDWTPLLTAISGSLILVIGALGAYIVRRLEHNTKVTEKVERQTNGRLKTAEEALARERDKVVGLIGVARNYRDLIRYIQAQHPDTAATIARWRDQRTSPVRSEDIETLAERMTIDEVTP